MIWDSKGIQREENLASKKNKNLAGCCGEVLRSVHTREEMWSLQSRHKPMYMTRSGKTDIPYYVMVEDAHSFVRGAAVR